MSFNDHKSGQKSPKESNKPVLTNGNEGSAAWLNTDKNGNVYVSVKLPLGLGHLNLFPASDAEAEAFNMLNEHLEGGGR